jgi:hypothetical protein
MRIVVILLIFTLIGATDMFATAFKYGVFA